MAFDATSLTTSVACERLGPLSVIAVMDHEWSRGESVEVYDVSDLTDETWGDV